MMAASALGPALPRAPLLRCRAARRTAAWPPRGAPQRPALRQWRGSSSWARASFARAVPERNSEASDTRILALTDGLRLLEAERDDAVKTAESCARTAVKLEEMARLLERLALDKVAEGDEPGARAVLQEKVAVAEVLARTSGRSQVNYALAAKLAEKIGQEQAELMELLGGGGAAQQTASASASGPATPPQADAGSARAMAGSSSASADSSRRSSGDAGSSAGSQGASGPAGFEAPWERSLTDARARITAAEQEAKAAGRAAAWRANESLEEARERLRSQAYESVAAAQQRIRATASESIEAARARIAAEDAEALRKVKAVVDRYKAGGYVPEEELDWAFSELQRRSWRG
ncbi:hypothetical protein HT031_006894 [Scenedesmus sp. PABB004]|nr:hypothetical protein HT031_006894 [Scenedesmus sp. PABB004]